MFFWREPWQSRLDMSRPWTPEEIGLLGTMPDYDLARRLGRLGKAVWAKRTALGIQAPPPLHPPWTKEADEVVLAKSINEASRFLNRTPAAISHRKSRLLRLRGLQRSPKPLTCEQAKAQFQVSRYESAAQEEKVRFVGGPYEPPWVPMGGWLKCELRGDLRVGGYTNALIPWPTAEGHARQLILCGDLVKALKTESRPAVSFHFGISRQIVSEYRRRLEIERLNPGSMRLFWRTVDLARTAEARAKMSRQREGRKDLMPPGDRERLRAIQRRPKSEAWKQRMSERWKRRHELLGRPKPWTEEELKLIGTAPDREVAKRLGRSLSALKGKKFALLKALRESGQTPSLPLNDAQISSLVSGG